MNDETTRVLRKMYEDITDNHYRSSEKAFILQAGVEELNYKERKFVDGYVNLQVLQHLYSEEKYRVLANYLDLEEEKNG